MKATQKKIKGGRSSMASVAFAIPLLAYYVIVYIIYIRLSLELSCIQSHPGQYIYIITKRANIDIQYIPCFRLFDAP